MRHRVLASCVVLLLALLMLPAFARAGEPTEQLSSAVGRALKTMDDPELKKPGQAGVRQKAIRGIAEEIFDFRETSRRALGSHWQQRTPEEREQFVRLFSDLLETSYLSKVDLYNGEKVAYVAESVDGDQAVVKTKIMTKQGSEVPVDYRMAKSGDRWRAYDVIIEGVSLISNYRAQFNKIIQTSSFDGLLTRMRSRAASSPSASPETAAQTH